MTWRPTILFFNGNMLYSLGVKRPWLEAEHLPPFIAEIRNECRIISSPIVCFHGAHNATLPLPLHKLEISYK